MNELNKYAMSNLKLLERTVFVTYKIVITSRKLKKNYKF